MPIDKTGRIARRVRDVAQTVGKRDRRARTFASLLQLKIPAAILVGGTAAAVHAGHRISFDRDHVVKDLAKNYDAAILALESIAGWHTHRRTKGKMVLGNVNKIAAGWDGPDLLPKRIRAPKGSQPVGASRSWIDTAKLCVPLGASLQPNN